MSSLDGYKVEQLCFYFDDFGIFLFNIFFKDLKFIINKLDYIFVKLIMQYFIMGLFDIIKLDQLFKFVNIGCVNFFVFCEVIFGCFIDWFFFNVVSFILEVF